MRRDYSHFALFTIAMVLLFSTLSFGQAWTGILAPTRATDWSYAGIPGGIPSRTTICANVLTSDSTAAIQAKINACATGQVVLFPAGSWTLATALYANKGIVLRGAGPTQTFLTSGSGHSAIFLGTNGSDGLGGYPSNLGSTNWTGGFTKGSTVLTLASTTGIVAGQTIVLDQHNAAYVYPDGVEGTCISGNSCGRNDSPLQFYAAETRSQPQMVQVVSVNSSTQITISAPGLAYDHNSSLSPQAFYWNSGAGNISYAGVENMSINANSSDHAISMPFCDFCWVKNVAVSNIARAGVFFWWSMGDVVRDSYFASTNTSGGPTQYGIELTATSLPLIENNIFYGITSNILPESSYGVVAGYNYTLNTATGAQFGSIEPHLSHNYLHLYEGNVLDEVMYDNSWGSSSQNTSFRNRLSGHSPNKSNYRTAVKINSQNHYMNIVGNVIGDPTYHTVYQCDNANLQTEDVFEYDLGFWDNCGAGTGTGEPYDTVTESSLMRWANWDAVTYLANGNTNGVRYCTGSGVGNAACTASETGSADATYPGLSGPSTTLPASFYMSAKPTWFGSVTWPAIGPDVTGGNISNTGGHANMIPSQACYTSGAKDGSGYLTAFDASVCYGSASATAPTPPTGVSAVVK